MKTLKGFIIGGIIFLLIAVGFGVYVWMQLQNLNRDPIPSTAPAAEQTTSETTDSAPSGPTVGELREETPPPAGTITIEESSLTADQKKLLERLGIDTSSMSITPSMVSCAEAKLGSARVDEIVQGGTPSFTEGLSVLPCLSE